MTRFPTVCHSYTHKLLPLSLIKAAKTLVTLYSPLMVCVVVALFVQRRPRTFPRRFLPVCDARKVHVYMAGTFVQYGLGYIDVHSASRRHGYRLLSDSLLGNQEVAPSW